MNVCKWGVLRRGYTATQPTNPQPLPEGRQTVWHTPVGSATARQPIFTTTKVTKPPPDAYTAG